MKLRFGPEKPVNIHFDWVAPIYDRLAPPPDIGKLKELLQLPATGRLLDAGGGTGRIAHQLAAGIDSIVVLDSSRPMLKQTQGKDALLAVQADVCRLPFPAASFARILVVDALHHFANQREVLCELLRVLQPGGRLLVQEFDRDRLPVRILALFEKLLLMGSSFTPPAQIADMLTACGAVAEIRDRSAFSTWIIAEKPF